MNLLPWMRRCPKATKGLIVAEDGDHARTESWKTMSRDLFA